MSVRVYSVTRSRRNRAHHGWRSEHRHRGHRQTLAFAADYIARGLWPRDPLEPTSERRVVGEELPR